MTLILGHDCCRGRWRSSSSMRTARRRQDAGWPFRLFQDSNQNEMELNKGDLGVEIYCRQARAATVGRQHPRPARPLHPDVRVRLAGGNRSRERQHADFIGQGRVAQILPIEDPSTY